MMENENKKIVFGNAYNDRNNRQWLMGYFIKPKDNLLFDEKVEIKWGNVRAGWNKGSWTKSTCAKTIAILMRGKFLMSFPDQDFILEKEGDYVLWGPGIAHTGRAIEDTALITVRWPSVRGDDVKVFDH